VCLIWRTENIFQIKFETFERTKNISVGTHGETSQVVGNVYDLSNVIRLGVTEFDATLAMHKSASVLIQQDRGIFGKDVVESAQGVGKS